jgi:hypothetical protein
MGASMDALRFAELKAQLTEEATVKRRRSGYLSS